MSSSPSVPARAAASRPPSGARSLAASRAASPPQSGERSNTAFALPEPQVEQAPRPAPARPEASRSMTAPNPATEAKPVARTARKETAASLPARSASPTERPADPSTTTDRAARQAAATEAAAAETIAGATGPGLGEEIDRRVRTATIRSKPADGGRRGIPALVSREAADEPLVDNPVPASEAEPKTARGSSGEWPDAVLDVSNDAKPAVAGGTEGTTLQPLAVAPFPVLPAPALPTLTTAAAAQGARATASAAVSVAPLQTASAQSPALRAFASFARDTVLPNGAGPVGPSDRAGAAGIVAAIQDTRVDASSATLPQTGMPDRTSGLSIAPATAAAAGSTASDAAKGGSNAEAPQFEAEFRGGEARIPAARTAPAGAAVTGGNGPVSEGTPSPPPSAPVLPPPGDQAPARITRQGSAAVLDAAIILPPASATTAEPGQAKVTPAPPASTPVATAHPVTAAASDSAGRPETDTDAGEPAASPAEAAPIRAADSAPRTAEPAPGLATALPAMPSAGDGSALPAPIVLPTTSSHGPAAPAAPPHAATPHPVLQDVRLPAVAVEIGLKSLAGINRFDIRLSPGDLGQIDVRLDIAEDGRVKAHLVVERPEAYAHLQRETGHLERALEQAGLKTTDDGVALSLRQQGSGDTGRQDGRDGRQSSPGAPSGREMPEQRPEIAARQIQRTILSSASGIDRRI